MEWVVHKGVDNLYCIKSFGICQYFDIYQYLNFYFIMFYSFGVFMTFKNHVSFIVSIIAISSLSGCVVNGLPAMSSATTQTAPLLVAGSQYHGTYYCHQGLTKLTISIDEVQDIYYQGRFSFYYNDKQQGIFKIHGSFDGNRFIAKPSDWIKRPAGYSTVGLNGKYNAQTGGFHGSVNGTNCGTFQLAPIK